MVRAGLHEGLLLTHLLVGTYTTVQPLWETGGRFLKKLDTDIAYGPTISLLGIYPKELKVGTQTDTSTPTFMAAFFTVTQR